MTRIASIWLRDWPIRRHLKAEQGRSATPGEKGGGDACFDPGRPLVLVAPGAGGARITALNTAARRAGLRPGDLLSNARAKVLDLEVRDADPTADAAALETLGLWCIRYTPAVAAWTDDSGADGLFLDIGASAHLFGGEASLLSDIQKRFRTFGLEPRLAIAATPGAGWALARYGRDDIAILSSGDEAAALRDLPLAGLRLPEATLMLARRLGLTRIGDVMNKPRGPLAHRFGAGLLLRLDQALGRLSEPLALLAVPAVYEARGTFLEPISSAEHITEAARRLFMRLAEDLVRDGQGARALGLSLYRTDGKTRRIDVGLAAPTRDAAHIVRLIALRLDRIADGLDADLDPGLGFEAMSLHVTTAEAMSEEQIVLNAPDDGPSANGLATLIDRLEQRLGAGSVQRFEARASHIPELAAVRRPATAPARGFDRSTSPLAARPLFLFERPEEAYVMALIPEGPPQHFRWRGVLHRIVHAEGPERIAPEWWRRDGAVALERDYYTIEDEMGRRFWLYRAGHYGREDVPPRWFLHGVFA